MFLSFVIATILAAPVSTSGSTTELRLDPPMPLLRGADARQQLLVTAIGEAGEIDATNTAIFASSNGKIATVSEDGVVLPVGNGSAVITATFDGRSSSVDVRVERVAESPSPHFSRDIIPLLTKSGCNSGACHGKQSGQNGFRLSVFGHDIGADYQAIVCEGRGRRLFPAVPRESLLLTKATNRVPHGGGGRLAENSVGYRRLLRWIEAGTPHGDDNAPHVIAIDVQPKVRTMRERSQQRLLVTAKLSDGSSRDVTHEAVYTSNDETRATVDQDGLISTKMMAGESAIVARYLDHVAASFIIVPLNSSPASSNDLAKWDRSHFIDRLVAEKWQRLRISPSPPADDATFHRRVYLDLIGKLPTPHEVTAFVADKSNDKRTRLVDALLNRPEYADYWALKWADLLRINSEDLGAKSAYRYHRWLRESLSRNQRYDELLRDLVLSQGPDETNGAVGFYRAFANPNDLTVAVSQVFLGIRLECAKCHHHPYEKWGQEDFYGLAAFFPRIQKKGSGSDLSFFVADRGQVTHPHTKEVVNPKVLSGESFDAASIADPRRRLAEWLAMPQNPFVARALVNRVWGQLMGRGLVEPMDDMRDTNPATNEPLLKALADDFVAHDFDLRHLIRTIAVSRVYGLSSEANADNLRDTQNYSRAYRKRLGAEVLLDAVCDVTGEPEAFGGTPPGTRAVQLWDHRLPSAFLDTFGRPQRKTVCQCERLPDSTLGQVLHLMNSQLVNDKVSAPTGRVADLVERRLSPDETIVELYLAALGRLPRPEEKAAARRAFESSGATPRSAAEDVLWALLNSAEFVLNH